MVQNKFYQTLLNCLITILLHSLSEDGHLFTKKSVKVQVKQFVMRSNTDPECSKTLRLPYFKTVGA